MKEARLFMLVFTWVIYGLPTLWMAYMEIMGLRHIPWWMYLWGGGLTAAATYFWFYPPPKG